MSFFPIINLQDSFFGTENVTWTITGGPPNGTYGFQFTDAGGVYASGTGQLDGAGAATVTTQLGQPEAPSDLFELSVFLYQNLVLTNNISDSISYIDPSPPPPPPTPPPPTILVSSTVTIQAVHQNDIHNRVIEVLGVGENGYGVSSFLSNAVTDRNVATASQWRRLQFDLNAAYKHITDQFVIPPGSIITGTTVINANLTNQFWNAANFVLDNRYTCHPNQYFVDPNTLATINTTEGTSTRTLVWGLEPDGSITHKVNVTWASRLTTRYFFNCGGKFEWEPYHTNASVTGLSLNDLDEEWASFINHFQQAETFVYDRQTYEDWITTSTVYNSGTLRISVLADQETDRNIRFTFTFTNLETPDLVVIPSTEYYNIIV